MNKKAKELYKLGREAYLEVYEGADICLLDIAYLQAMAAMIEAATNPKSKAKAKTQPKLAFTPQQVYNYLNNNCEGIDCSHRPASSFGRLGKSLQKNRNIGQEEIETLANWIDAGGLSWRSGKPTWVQFISAFDHWIASALAWQRKQDETEKPLKMI